MSDLISREEAINALSRGEGCGNVCRRCINNIPAVPAIPIPENAINADLFKQVFGIYATELWSMPEKEFLEWLNREVKLNEVN